MALKGKTMLLGLFSIWLCIAYSSAQTTESIENSTEPDVVAVEGTTESVHVSTEPPPFSIRMQPVDSSTSSITFNWTVPRIYEVEYYVVNSRRNDSEAITTSPQLTETEYTIEDLRKESIYSVCVTAYKDGADYHQTEQCSLFKTIKTIRDDSLIALFCVIGFVLLCILGGFLCWKYQQRKLQKEEEGDEEYDFDENEAAGPS